MDTNRMRADRTLVCTCNDLHREDIKQSIDIGCAEPEEIMFDHATQFRCDMCRPILEIMIERGC